MTDYKAIGRPTRLTDGRAKVTGEARYAADVQLPGPHRILTVVMLLALAGCSQPIPRPTTQSAPTLPPSTPVIVPTRPTPTPVPTPTRVEPPASPAATSTGSNQSFRLGFEPVVSGFSRPLYVTHARDGSGRLFVVEQPGRIWIMDAELGQRPDQPFLDITPLVDSGAFERGLLSVAFHPDFEANGLFFVNYTRKPDGATVIARYAVSGDPDVADPGSATLVLTIAQPEPNHNGGLIQFGPDGYLYVGMGDGGGAGDRHGSIGNGQDPDARLGKLLRIDVDADMYAIPSSNPFANGQAARPEIWALGLRNPWRFSFDRSTGDVYIADVGQGAYEEVNFQPASSAGGENYGWRIMEGNHCYNPRQGCDQSGLALPVAEYSHEFGCSVTGGYVYRGSNYPWLDGVYFFADYCSGIVWSLERNPSTALGAGVAGAWSMTRQTQADFRVSSFGEDEAGELYLTGHDDGTVYRLTSTSP